MMTWHGMGGMVKSLKIMRDNLSSVKSQQKQKTYLNRLLA